MNDARYKWLLYVILIVILSTIGIQVYWNYKNYQINKQQLINDVQVSLDNAIDATTQILQSIALLKVLRYTQTLKTRSSTFPLTLTVCSISGQKIMHSN